mmetsp:Transcript_16481/g.34011  ORF Transcript_16481/g.34011 Transcript_16481/m.34011 type:complete len:142 (-) Transcript_16481:152-577(-)
MQVGTTNMMLTVTSLDSLDWSGVKGVGPEIVLSSTQSKISNAQAGKSNRKPGPSKSAGRIVPMQKQGGSVPMPGPSNPLQPRAEQGSGSMLNKPNMVQKKMRKKMSMLQNYRMTPKMSGSYNEKRMRLRARMLSEAFSNNI